MSESKRTFVLDTSVLLSSPRAMFNFAEHEVVLPLVVITELESKRNDPDLGGPARAALRYLEALRIKHGDLREGVPITEEGGFLKIEINHVTRTQLPSALQSKPSNDTRIIAVAAGLSKEDKKVTLISKDLPMRILASAVEGLRAEDYLGDVVPDFGYIGVEKISVPTRVIDDLFETKKLRTKSVDDMAETKLGELPIHTGVILKSSENSSSALARIGAQGSLDLIPQDMEAFGVKGKSAEQKIALAQLLDDNIGIVSLGGAGGTGKSLIALAAALELVMERNKQKRIIVFRPLYSVGGQDLGFLPGSEEEKMGPWGAAVFDALSAFASQNVIEDIMARKLIEVLPLTYIRGRTFTDTIVIIDEAQNLERHVLLTALSRTGDNTRVFVTHDVAQRDNLRVNRHDGIAAVVEKLKGEDLFAHVTLTKSERSPVAELVTRLLDQE